MGTKMTWDEMKRTYPNEWVAIADPQGDLSIPYGAISGEILAHERDERSFTECLKHITTPNPVDIRYTGDLLPDNPVGPILWQISNTNS